MQDLEGKVIETTEGTKYVLTDIVGEGAQGTVYNEASERYLIKLYNSSNPIQNKNRFNKLKWLMQQNYPDQFIHPLAIIETPFVGYIMEKVEGHYSLNKLLIPPRDVSFSEWYNKQTGGLLRRLFLAHKIAMQFALLHDTNRAYCDISGNNILVNSDPSKASVCMIDIDNIYIPGGDSGNVLGTSRYMAPEIVNRQLSPDIITDDYSLAVILFELLRTGHPYVGDIVDDGTPEQQTQAYLGLYPYVDDPNNDINRSSQMLPIDVVTTKKLKNLFAKTFIQGKENRMMRASARELSLACLEAYNSVMKCSNPQCGCWFIAKKKYICPWCDKENSKPWFLQFKDRYSIVHNNELGKEVYEDKAVHSFVLRDEKNDITRNYISNAYVKRDIFSKPIDIYFMVRKAKNGEFYVINSSNNELYLQKKGSKEYLPITSKSKPVLLEKNDRLFFQNPEEMVKKELDRYSTAILFRYAVVI